MFDIERAAGLAALAAGAALGMLVAGAPVHAANLPLGTPADRNHHDRTVFIGANTRFVHVDAGEVVTFVVRDPGGADRSFTWHFERVRETVADLAAIAPAGAIDHPVKVVVGPNPLY